MADRHKFSEGNPGRPKGAQNRLTKTVRETFAEVFNKIQSDPQIKLEAFAKKFPREFYAIASKLIPTEIVAQVVQTNINVIRDDNGAKELNGQTLQITSGTESDTTGSQEV